VRRRKRMEGVEEEGRRRIALFPEMLPSKVATIWSLFALDLFLMTAVGGLKMNWGGGEGGRERI
jgi:hypothetical protein